MTHRDTTDHTAAPVHQQHAELHNNLFKDGYSHAPEAGMGGKGGEPKTNSLSPEKGAEAGKTNSHLPNFELTGDLSTAKGGQMGGSDGRQAMMDGAQKTLANPNASASDKLGTVEKLAENGVKGIQVPDADGKMRDYKIGVDKSGSHNMVHLYGKDENGKDQVVLRGIDNGNGSFSQEKDSRGHSVSFEGSNWGNSGGKSTVGSLSDGSQPAAQGTDRASSQPVEQGPGQKPSPSMEQQPAQKTPDQVAPGTEQQPPHAAEHAQAQRPPQHADHGAPRRHSRHGDHGSHQSHRQSEAGDAQSDAPAQPGDAPRAGEAPIQTGANARSGDTQAQAGADPKATDAQAPAAKDPKAGDQTTTPKAGADATAGNATDSQTPKVDRSQFDKQLEDPKVMAAFAGRMDKEVGSQGHAAQVAFAEEVMNRAAARGQTLMHALSGGYYPTSHPGSSHNPEYQSAIKEAWKGGSDTIHGATGNSSGTTGFGVRGGHYDSNQHWVSPNQTARINGERFGVEAQDVSRGWLDKYHQLRGDQSAIATTGQ